MGGIGRSIKSIFSPPKPKAPSVAKAPTRAKPSPGALAKRRNTRTGYGRSSTILTGGQGVMEEADIRKKTLLG